MIAEDRVKQLAALAGKVLADIAERDAWLNPTSIQDVRVIAAGLFSAASVALDIHGSVSYGPPPSPPQTEPIDA